MGPVANEMPISWNLSYAWYGGKFLSATGSQERKLYPGKSYSFERDAFQVLSFYAKKGCDIIDFWIRLFLHFTGQVTSNQNELSDQYILGLLWYAMDFLNRAISRRLVFSHENAIWIDWNPRAISVTILSKTHFGFGSDLVTGNTFSIFFHFQKVAHWWIFLLADRPGHIGALVQRPELF